jgi:uncharacterized repeat protein (TIGR03803 family)
VIFTFNGTNGSNPEVGLTLGANGALYGVTSNGGIQNGNCSGCGTVFKLTPNAARTTWTHSFVHRFTGGTADGSLPQGRLLRDSAGNLYGTTFAGGTNQKGIVFRIRPTNAAQTTWARDILYRFTGGATGANPQNGLIFDSKNRLIGTTSREGKFTGQCSSNGRGCGTVFLLTPKSTLPWSRSNLLVLSGVTDGMEPSGDIIRSGNVLFLTARLGGANNQGSVIRLTPTNTNMTTFSRTLIYSFKAGTDGKSPWGIAMSTAGRIFGLTELGGNNSNGTIFQLTPSGNSFTYSVRHRFTGGADGSGPEKGAVFMTSTTEMFGLAESGGNAGGGTFFRYRN